MADIGSQELVAIVRASKGKFFQNFPWKKLQGFSMEKIVNV